MSVIGVYDSGIGGLTTLATLVSSVKGYDFFYLADNKNMPFGLKTQSEIYKTVTDGLKILRDNSDVQVIACNTASTVVQPKNAYLLHPNLENSNPENTLVLSTPATAKALNLAGKKYQTADTKNLATLVEIMASISYKSRGEIRLEILDDYMCRILGKFKKNQGEIKQVFLGCSHYVYVRGLVKKYLGDVEIFDGNSTLKDNVKADLKNRDGDGKISFKFTRENEEDKYRWVLDNLNKNKKFFGLDF